MVKCPKKVKFLNKTKSPNFSSVHFSIKRYPIDELPASDTAKMNDWLNERWEEKEEKLRKFYRKDKKFFDTRKPYWDKRPFSIWIALIFWPLFR